MNLSKFLLFALLLPCSAFAQNMPDATIQWMTWTEAVARNREQPKKIFVDVYTEWCGWCKKMDQTTFQDPKVVAFLNAVPVLSVL